MRFVDKGQPPKGAKYPAYDNGYLSLECPAPGAAGVQYRCLAVPCRSRLT